MPNTPACVLFLAVACVRLFAAPVEAGYVTSSALLSRPPSQAAALTRAVAAVADAAAGSIGVAGVEAGERQTVGTSRDLFAIVGKHMGWC